jgi:hypothetical protein
VNRIIGLYPRSWRDRYEGEFLGILEARPPTFRDRIDIVRGAVDARLHPQLPTSGADEPQRRRFRADVVLAILAGALWAAAGLGYATAGVDAELGYKDTGRFLVMVLGGALLGAIVAFRFAQMVGGGKRGYVTPAAVMAFGAIAMVLPWPILALGYYATLIGTMLFGAVAAGRLGRTPYALVAAALFGLGFNTETASALLLVPIGVAWILFGARLALGGPTPAPDPDGASQVGIP